jgi:hypothetical protein
MDHGVCGNLIESDAHPTFMQGAAFEIPMACKAFPSSSSVDVRGIRVGLIFSCTEDHTEPSCRFIVSFVSRIQRCPCPPFR